MYFEEEDREKRKEPSVLSKCFHSSVMQGSKMVVFGGYNFNNLNSNQVYVLELDPQGPALLELQLRTRKQPPPKTLLLKKSSQLLTQAESKHTLRRDATSLEIKSIRKPRDRGESGHNLSFVPARESSRKSEWLDKARSRNQEGYQLDHHMMR